MRFSLWLSLYRQKELRWKPLRRNAEAADWRCGAQDYGWKHAHARLCTSPPRSLRFGFPIPETLSSGGRRKSLCLRPAEDAHKGVHTELPQVQWGIHKHEEAARTDSQIYFSSRNTLCTSVYRIVQKTLTFGFPLKVELWLPHVQKGTNKRTEHPAAHGMLPVNQEQHQCSLWHHKRLIYDIQIVNRWKKKHKEWKRF